MGNKYGNWPDPLGTAMVRESLLEDEYHSEDAWTLEQVQAIVKLELAKVAPPSGVGAALDDEAQITRVMDAVAEAIGGDAYDCLRVWSAWGVGTMGQDDFHPITEGSDRLRDIARAAILASTGKATP